MQINITGHHIEITNALHDLIHQKMQKVHHHFSNITQAHVILTVEKKIHHKAEVTLHLAGSEIHAEATTADMYMSIDEMVDKLDRQVVKHKEKMKMHQPGPKDEI